MTKNISQAFKLLYLAPHHEFSQIFVRLLTQEGYQVNYYSNVEYALSQCTISSFDLCLCEFKLFKIYKAQLMKNQPRADRPTFFVLSPHFTQQDKLYLNSIPYLGYFEFSTPFKVIALKIKTSLQQTPFS